MQEQFKPVAKAMEDMSNKLGEAYTQLNNAFQPFKEELEKLSQQLSKINGNPTKQPPASHALQNDDINRKVEYPCNCGSEANLRSVIMHLNDMHKWTREAIADWLDTLPVQPIYYPDVRTDDEKISDAQQMKKVSAVGVNNPIAAVKITSGVITASSIGKTPLAKIETKENNVAGEATYYVGVDSAGNVYTYKPDNV